MQHGTRTTRLTVVGYVILSCVDFVGAADEPNSLSEAHQQILTDLESRWWGWRSESAPIVPAPKWWKSLDQVWKLSREQEVVVATGADSSPQESYIAEMLRRELIGRHSRTLQEALARFGRRRAAARRPERGRTATAARPRRFVASAPVAQLTCCSGEPPAERTPR